MIEVKLSFESAAAAADAMARLAGVIAPMDRPDAGACAGTCEAHKHETPATVIKSLTSGAPDDPATAFGPATTAPSALPSTPVTVAALPAIPPIPAPSTAVAATQPSAPAAQTPGFVAPPIAAVPPAPTPALPVAAPTAPAAPTTPVPAAAGPELDSTGLPWDGAIHASPAKKTDPKPRNADGSWRRKRGTADTFYNERVAQLRAAATANAAAATLPAPSAPTLPVAPAPAAPPAPTLPTAPALPVAPAAPPAPVGLTFADLVTKYEAHMLRPDFNWAHFATLLPAGFTSVNQLMHAPNLIPEFDAKASAWLGLAPGKVA